MQRKLHQSWTKQLDSQFCCLSNLKFAPAQTLWKSHENLRSKSDFQIPSVRGNDCLVQNTCNSTQTLWNHSHFCLYKYTKKICVNKGEFGFQLTRGEPAVLGKINLRLMQKLHGLKNHFPTFLSILSYKFCQKIMLKIRKLHWLDWILIGQTRH